MNGAVETHAGSCGGTITVSVARLATRGHARAQQLTGGAEVPFVTLTRPVVLHRSSQKTDGIDTTRTNLVTRSAKEAVVTRASPKRAGSLSATGGGDTGRGVGSVREPFRARVAARRSKKASKAIAVACVRAAETVVVAAVGSVC